MIEFFWSSFQITRLNTRHTPKQGNQIPHDTEHLFNCSANPTDLTIYDLWNNPKEVIDFLDVDEDE